MNTIQKYVVSNSLTNPDWTNTTVISGDVTAEIRRLKATDGQDIVQYGFGSVTKLLMKDALLDELRLWLYPQTIDNGAAADLLAAYTTAAQFRFFGSTTLSNGIVILRYLLAR